MNDKKVVHYQKTKYDSIHVGCSATVFPIDHPDEERVSNATYITTSTVIKHDKASGIFETLNTVYHPL